MDGWLEFLKMAGALGAALVALAWIGSGSRRRFGRTRSGAGRHADDPITDDMRDIGTLGGMGGGDLEDVMIGRHALRRMKIGERERGED